MVWRGPVSKTCTVEFGGVGFWAYSDGLATLLARAAVVADEMSPEARPAGFEDVVDHVRMSALVTDLGFVIDDDWRGERLNLLIRLIDEAARRLREQPRVEASDVVGWVSVEGLTVQLRADAIDTAPVVELAEGMLELFHESLAPAPEGTWWFCGAPEGRSTIRMRAL